MGVVKFEVARVRWSTSNLRVIERDVEEIRGFGTECKEDVMLRKSRRHRRHT